MGEPPLGKKGNFRCRTGCRPTNRRTHTKKPSSSFCCAFSSTLCLPHKCLLMQQISRSPWRFTQGAARKLPHWFPKRPSSLSRCRPSLSPLCGHPNPTDMGQRRRSIPPRTRATPLVTHPMPLCSLCCEFCFYCLFRFYLLLPLQAKRSEGAPVSEGTSAAGFAGEIRTYLAKDGLTGFVNLAK